MLGTNMYKVIVLNVLTDNFNSEDTVSRMHETFNVCNYKYISAYKLQIYIIQSFLLSYVYMYTHA